MEEKNGVLKNSQIIVLGLCIAVAAIVSSVILARGIDRALKFTRQVITVTGSAQKEIKSDFVSWRGEFSVRAEDLVTAYRSLQEDLSKVKSYLYSKGISEQDLIIEPVQTMVFYRTTPEGRPSYDVEGYGLSQSVEVRSAEVEKISAISREATELINEGVEFQSLPPSFFYTRLDELKVEMLGKATENAKQRAERMAAATGNRIGLMRSAKMGVFQITPVTSTEVSDYGYNDTSSLDKKVTAVVSVTFAIE